MLSYWCIFFFMFRFKKFELKYNWITFGLTFERQENGNSFIFPFLLFFDGISFHIIFLRNSFHISYSAEVLFLGLARLRALAVRSQLPCLIGWSSAHAKLWLRHMISAGVYNSAHFPLPLSHALRSAFSPLQLTDLPPAQEAMEVTEGGWWMKLKI